VHGILIAGKAKVYRVASFPDEVGVFNDVFNNAPIVVAGSKGNKSCGLF
jgi:hypothetical protein